MGKRKVKKQDDDPNRENKKLAEFLGINEMEHEIEETEEDITNRNIQIENDKHEIIYNTFERLKSYVAENSLNMCEKLKYTTFCKYFEFLLSHET